MGNLRVATSFVAAWLMGLGVLLGVTTTAPASAAAPYDGGRTTLSGEPTSMGQTNGPVWTLEMAGGRVYAGGQFTSTRPAGAAAGARETGQAALAAFDAASGAPITGFRPRFENRWSGARPVVWASVLSPDKRTLWVAGDFTHVDGVEVRRVARFDTATGRLLSPLGDSSPGADGTVTALAISPDGATLYLGGTFKRVRFQDRVRLAAVSTSTGSVVASWDPTVAGAIPTVGGAKKEAERIESLAVSGDGGRVFLAGPFRQVNGVARQGFAAVTATDGALAPGFRSANYLAAPYGWGTVVETVGDRVYLAGRDDGTSGLSRREGVYSLNSRTGAPHWYANCYGDTFGLQVVGSQVFVATHAHDCSRAGGHPETSPRNYMAVTALNTSNGRVRPYFVQTQAQSGVTGSNLLSRALASDGRQLVMGGGYAKVNDRPQANLTRFVPGSATPAAMSRPGVSTCRKCRGARVRFTTTWDRDDVALRYQVLRRGKVVRTVGRTSVRWGRQTIVVHDRNVKRPRVRKPVRVSYRIRAIDPSGRARFSPFSRTATVYR